MSNQPPETSRNETNLNPTESPNNRINKAKINKAVLSQDDIIAEKPQEKKTAKKIKSDPLKIALRANLSKRKKKPDHQL